MATSKEYIDYVLECLDHIEGIDARQMFGDYGLYMFNRVIGFVCDDQVFLKVLPGSTRVLGEKIRKVKESSSKLESADGVPRSR